MEKQLTALALALALSSTANATELTVISYGGVSKTVQTEVFYQPFEAAHQAKLIAGEYNGEMARIKAMVDTNSVNWDVVQVESDKLVRGCDEGLFEPLDTQRIGKVADFVPGTLSECGAGLLVWSMTMAYNADALTDAPQGWADFWNVTKYPGKRALQRGAKFTLEAALLADGVPQEQVYKVLATPEGVDRAFSKLDELKPNIQWWEAGAQPMQYLAAKDVVMTTAFNGRIFAAEQSGAHIKPVWGGSIHAIDYWAIPRGSKNKELAEEFIASTLTPEAQKLHSTKLGYGSVNLHTAELLDKGIAAQLNMAPQNIKQSLAFDNEFWIDHGEELEARFNAWVARG
ncbi:ABC transporter substrate-binding protein [Pseudomonas sp. NPDC089392]|uniref:ABC transporter substrate-binding protein n=1 Tax=Pseudomonas sp. NPDC089392 TaxID=3364459 RepID=UPI003821FED1